MTMRGAPRAARDDDDKQAGSDEKQYVSPLFSPSHVPPKSVFFFAMCPLLSMEECRFRPGMENLPCADGMEEEEAEREGRTAE